MIRKIKKLLTLLVQLSLNVLLTELPLWPPKKIDKIAAMFCFFCPWKNGLKWHHWVRRIFILLIQTLQAYLAERSLILRPSIVRLQGDPKFLNFQIPQILDIQNSNQVAMNSPSTRLLFFPAESSKETQDVHIQDGILFQMKLFTPRMK